jgi:hypothetical protein
MTALQASLKHTDPLPKLSVVQDSPLCVCQTAEQARLPHRELIAVESWCPLTKAFKRRSIERVLEPVNQA